MARAADGGLRIATRALGNILLGVALGLLGYYSVTNLVTLGQQRELSRGLAPVIAAELPAVVAGAGPALDFSGWDAEDARYFADLADGEAMGRLVSSAMDLDAVVVKGTDRSDLRKGPGWITWSDPPGPSGNCGISGHRTTYGAPFRRIDQLKQGDTIEFYSPYRRYTYRVARTMEVTPDRVDVVESTKTPTLTLTACHPPYSARLRYIVQAELEAVARFVK